MKLAILIPAYNCENTIGDTISSLQSVDSGWPYVDRVVVCDDASTDGTTSAVEAANFDKCPLYLLRHSSNRGEAACYETMLACLPHDIRWFLILHSDDLALQCFIDRNLEILNRCPERVAAVSSNYYNFAALETQLAHTPAEDRIIFRGNAPKEIHHTASVGCWWHISGSLVNRRAWEEMGGRDSRFPVSGDWHLMLRWQKAGYLVGHSLLPTTNYRINAQSVSSKSFKILRDVIERTEVALALQEIFTISIRLRLAKQIGLTGLRRTTRFLLSGETTDALHALSTSSHCVLRLLRTTR
ncbi:MAG: glycosyltransferase [Hyphomicrobiaceae bacterium]|nr:glycosyltransferase [Hyphomicrobiaceae bacterium]